MEWNPLAPGARSFDVEDAPAPLFRDPVFDGAADPSIAWHRENEEWWLFYRRSRPSASGLDPEGEGRKPD